MIDKQSCSICHKHFDNLSLSYPYKISIDNSNGDELFCPHTVGMTLLICKLSFHCRMLDLEVVPERSLGNEQWELVLGMPISQVRIYIIVVCTCAVF